MTAQITMSLPPRPADQVLRDKIERVRLAMTDPDIEPASLPRLTREVERLEKLLDHNFTTEGEK